MIRNTPTGRCNYYDNNAYIYMPPRTHAMHQKAIATKKFKGGCPDSLHFCMYW